MAREEGTSGGWSGGAPSGPSPKIRPNLPTAPTQDASTFAPVPTYVVGASPWESPEIRFPTMRNRPPIYEAWGPGAPKPETEVFSYSTGFTLDREGYTTLNEQWFEESRTISHTQTWEEAWDVFVGAAGIEAVGEQYDIDLNTNWWPGLNTPSPEMDWQNWKPGYFGFVDPDKAWRVPGMDYTFTNEETGESFSRHVRYDPNRAAQQFMVMGKTERARFTNLMVEAGMLPEEWKGIGDFHPVTAAAFADALGEANYWGDSVSEMLKKKGNLFAKLEGRRGGGGGGGGGGGPKVQVEVPTYETILQQVKEMISAQLGRDPDDYEMKLVADHMQMRYGQWASATKARMLGGNGTFEIPDPQTLTQSYIENIYAGEIDRLDDVEDTAAVNQILMQAAARGTEMSGGGLGFGGQ